MKTTCLKDAYRRSHYAILGAAGNLDEWVTGYNKLLDEQGIGTPTCWSRTTGEDINDYVAAHGEVIDFLASDLVVLTFPLDGLNVAKLAMFMLDMKDRWFDDVIDNMVASGSLEDDWGNVEEDWEELAKELKGGNPEGYSFPL